MQKEKVKIASLIEVPELKNFYSEQSINELKNSIETDGLKNPISITENLEIIDGYRRLYAIKALNIDEIEVFKTLDKAIIKNRITRNMYRTKTINDKVNEVKELFKMNPKKQGKKIIGKPRKEIIYSALGLSNVSIKWTKKGLN